MWYRFSVPAYLVWLLIFTPLSFAGDRTKVGVSLPLSGGSASEGSDLQSLLTFANRQIADGAYELVFEDDHCTDKDAVNIAHKFADIDKLRYVIGFACSGAVLAAAPVYERAGILTIALATGAPDISKAGEFIFRTIPSLDVAAEKLFSHAAAHYRHVAIVSEETGYSQGLARAFLGLNTNNVLQIDAEDFLPGNTDFRAIFTKLKAKKVEAVFLNPQSETGMITMYKQLREFGWQVPVYGTYYPGFKSFLDTFGTRADGIIFADLPFLADNLTESSRDLYQRYVELHGAPQSSEFYFITALAGFHALHSAVGSGEDPRQHLYNTKFDSAVGPFHFDRNGDIRGNKLSFVLKTIRGGDVVAVPG